MFRETIRLIPPDILHPPCRSHSAFTHNLSLPHCGQSAALIMCSLSSCGRVDRASILSVDSGHCRRCPSSRPEVVSLLPFHQPYEIYSRYSHMFAPLAPLLSCHLNLTLRLIFRCVSCAKSHGSDFTGPAMSGIFNVHSFFHSSRTCPRNSARK